ncbi:hypothetical protein F2P81_009810 [Scophthalmus maximus]|uniref:Uncharacterized protein n=2 Tax=Scophthalmus maximus TaxID=52904 RepID=A0A6A4SPA0_SCOMX|nr:hypothetical protein F2P81_009810 [Scophthalmus maximus]
MNPREDTMFMNRCLMTTDASRAVGASRLDPTGDQPVPAARRSPSPGRSSRSEQRNICSAVNLNLTDPTDLSPAARRRSVMGLRQFWRNYQVLIVMVPSLALVHWGWYNLKSSPLLRSPRDEFVPEPGIVTYVLNPPAAPVAPPPPPPAAVADAKRQ